MIISNGWAEAHWWKKAILSPGQPACSRHVCVPTLGLPGPNASSPTSTPRCWNPPKSRSDSSDFTSGKPGHLHLTCDGILSAPGWPWTMAICTFICLSLLESRGHFLLNHRAHSRCMQIFAKGKEDKRRMRGNISRFENFTMERTFETRGAYHSPTESGWPLIPGRTSWKS